MYRVAVVVERQLGTDVKKMAENDFKAKPSLNKKKLRMSLKIIEQEYGIPIRLQKPKKKKINQNSL